MKGPLEIALVFLRDVAEGKQPAARHHNKLRLCFKDFLKKFVHFLCDATCDFSLIGLSIDHL